MNKIHVGAARRDSGPRKVIAVGNESEPLRSDQAFHKIGQELKESAALLAEGAVGATAPVKLGNIYLLRLTDRHDRTFQRIVKVMVVAYTPNESVTIRWQVL